MALQHRASHKAKRYFWVLPYYGELLYYCRCTFGCIFHAYKHQAQSSLDSFWRKLNSFCYVLYVLMLNWKVVGRVPEKNYFYPLTPSPTSTRVFVCIGRGVREEYKYRTMGDVPSKSPWFVCSRARCCTYIQYNCTCTFRMCTVFHSLFPQIPNWPFYPHHPIPCPFLHDQIGQGRKRKKEPIKLILQ